jgi:hypothetical protein
MAFIKATRKQIKLKLAITGAAGSGKTYSALRLAHGLGQKVALIDTEDGSASLYSDKFNFDTLDMKPPYTHEKFIAAITDAEAAGYDVLVIDSASHFWEGILDYKSKLDARGGNSYTNWNDAGQKFKGILDSVLQSKLHVICCMRSKMDYVQEKDDRGKTTIRKVGLAPIMRDNISYEFTTVWDVDQAHQAQSNKDRTGLFGDTVEQITEAHGKRLLKWLEGGAVVVDEPKALTAADLGAAFKEVNARLNDKSFLIAKATEAAGYPISAANDIKPEDYEKVIAAWKALP